MNEDTTGFDRYERLMRAAGQPELAIEVFRHHFEQLVSGATGLMPEASIAPLASLPDAEGLGAFVKRGEAELDRLVVVKLNGGLGTSMGMDQAKSLLPAKDGRAFIDLIVEQLVHLRAATGARLPLVLMDSFRTQADTRAALAAHPELLAGHGQPFGPSAGGQTLPLSFLQHQVPKVLVAGLGPAAELALDDPELAWCPPGHGDLYPALATSGMLARLLADGYRWAFVSNADNLGATPDALALSVLGWMAERALPFVMECADRTAADRKGGHLAQDLDGRLVLREVAQCPGEDAAAFQDIERHRYFNTNNLWIDLVAIQKMLDERGRSTRAAAHPEQEVARPDRRDLGRGLSARDRHGCGDFAVARGGRGAGAALAVPAREDDQRSVGAVVGRLRAHARRSRAGRAGVRERPAAGRPGPAILQEHR